MFENHRKSLIQHCERSELRLHFEWTKVHYKCQKIVNLSSFWKTEACSKTVLPDRSILIGQKLVKNAKFKNSKATFWVVFKHCVLPYLLSIFRKFTHFPRTCSLFSCFTFISSSTIIRSSRFFWCTTHYYVAVNLLLPFFLRDIFLFSFRLNWNPIIILTEYKCTDAK